MISRETPSTRTCFPRTSGAAPKRRRQVPSVIRATFRLRGHIIGVNKITAELRSYLEDFEKVRAHSRASDALRRGSISTRQVVGVTPIESEIRKGVLRRAPIEKVRITDGTGRERRRAFAETEQLLGVWVWQWPQEDRVDHAEDGGVCADTERKSEDGESGEPGRFRDHAKRVADVLKQGLHKFEFRGAHAPSRAGFGALAETIFSSRG